LNIYFFVFKNSFHLSDYLKNIKFDQRIFRFDKKLSKNSYLAVDKNI